MSGVEREAGAGAVATPGPWLRDGNAFIYALNPEGHNRMWISVHGGHEHGLRRVSLEEVKAVADLVFAAPDLLAALQEARDYVLDYGSDTNMAPVVARIDAAIARATGVSA